MSTRKPPPPHPTQPPAQPARRHGANKPVAPTTHTAALPPPVARARGSNQARTLAYAATEQRGPVAPTRIKVRAMRQGYYDHIRRHEGDVFYIEKEEHFGRWMERVPNTTPERITTAPQALRREHDRLLADRMPSSGTPLVDDEPDADKNPLGA